MKQIWREFATKIKDKEMRSSKLNYEIYIFFKKIIKTAQIFIKSELFFMFPTSRSYILIKPYLAMH